MRNYKAKHQNERTPKNCSREEETETCQKKTI
jgi:hypothetical protein